jgi:hypothetical protein
MIKTVFKINFWMALCLSVLVSFTGCKDDETGGATDTAALETLISQAQTLVDGATEGITVGLYKPGSKKQLQEVIDWCKWAKMNLHSQEGIVNAVAKLNKYITWFKANTVGLAIPWIQQAKDTYIKIDDSPAGTAGRLRDIAANGVTVEISFYPISLANLGYSNNIIGYVQGDGGSKDLGLDIRYFADGVIHLNVGGNGWHETASAPGTIQNGQWNHIAVVANSGHQVLYVNGQKVCEQNQTYGVPDPGFDFAIGNTGVWTDRAVNAMVKNLRIWSVERTESQIQATMDQEVDLATTGLEVYFPFTADLGTEFVDATGKFKAKLKGDVAWQENGTPPVIVLEKDALTAAITEVTTFKDGLTEGMNNGDYPVGTKVYLQELIDTANDMLTDADRQSQLDDMVSKIKKAIKLVKANTVAPAEGVYIDRDDADAVGLRITPNYAPAGDFTVELDLRAKTLMMGPNGNNGGIFGAGEYGMFLWGYDELTEEKVLAAGQIGNYNHWDGSPEWWMWVKSGPGVIKSGQWHHVALVHDDTAMTNTIYVDGVQVAQEMNFKVPNPSGGAEIWLGNYWAKINGSIKDFRFWDEVRTPAQLNADITGSEANLRMYFPLDKVAGVKFDAKTGAYKAEIRGIKWNVTSSSN